MVPMEIRPPRPAAHQRRTNQIHRKVKTKKKVLYTYAQATAINLKRKEAMYLKESKKGYMRRLEARNETGEMMYLYSQK